MRTRSKGTTTGVLDPCPAPSLALAAAAFPWTLRPMRLFSERTVADVERLPGADHSYLKQLCAPEGLALRDGLRSAVHQLGGPFETRATELLSSLDNRKFFQGFAETCALSTLHASGWSVRQLHGKGPRLMVGRLSGPTYALSVLAFLQQTRPGGDEASRQRLLEGLNRVASRQRFVVLIRRWLPHDFAVDPLRRAVEMWLSQVQSGSWEGRYAAYEDDHVSLEFGLTGERATGRQTPVALILGPFAAHRTMEVIEPRVVRELDGHRASTLRDQPQLIACVSDQPWSVNDGYLGDFLYGRPSCTNVGADGATYTFSGPAGPCAFRDPLYAHFAGFLMLDRRPERPLEVRARAWLNPWATHPLTPGELGIPTFARDDAAAGAEAARGPTLRWYAARHEAVPIG